MLRRKFEVLERWVGYVEKVNRKTFVARMQSDKQICPEYIRVFINRLPKKEQDHVKKGRILFMSLGQLPGRKMECRIRFDKRKWTKEQIRKVNKAAEKLISILWREGNGNL